MNIDMFFQYVKNNNIEMNFDNKEHYGAHRLSNEVLFQLPFISLTILLLAKDRRKPKTEEIGQLVGECFENSIRGFKGSTQALGWSANLRMRTVKALTFLETARLVLVDTNNGRVKITDNGKKIVDAALAQDSNLSINLRKISRSYRNLSVEKQIAMGL